MAGKRGINYFRFRGTPADTSYTQFEDRPQFDEIEALANKYISMYIKGEIDRLDVSYTQFVNSSRQTAVVQTLLPMTTAQVAEATASVRQRSRRQRSAARP